MEYRKKYGFKIQAITKQDRKRNWLDFLGFLWHIRKKASTKKCRNRVKFPEKKATEPIPAYVNEHNKITDPLMGGVLIFEFIWK